MSERTWILEASNKSQLSKNPCYTHHPRQRAKQKRKLALSPDYVN